MCICDSLVTFNNGFFSFPASDWSEGADQFSRTTPPTAVLRITGLFQCTDFNLEYIILSYLLVDKHV